MQQRILANRLAALATHLAERIEAGAEDLSPSAAAALQGLRQTGPASIQEIAATVGLTHSATVRLVDRLEKDWLVRRLTRKGREVRVEATARGRRRAGVFQDRRIDAAETLLSVLDTDEQTALAALLDKMLELPVDGRGTAERICRACERDACHGAGCPVEAAARRLEASADAPGTEGRKG